MTQATETAGQPDVPGGGSPCPLCRSCGHDPFRSVDGYEFRECGDCGFVFLDPMPDETVLDGIYNQDQLISPTFYPKAGARFRRALRLALRLLPYTRGRSILDVGCGGGFQAGAFRAFNRSVCGLDISLPSIEYARGRFPQCEFYCESFDKFSNRGRIFDFIYSSEVIEHVIDLKNYMRFLVNITGSGTLLYITTPDIGSPRVPREITEWDVFSPPRHVQFFTHSTLERAFADHGFVPVRRFRDRKTGLRMLFRRT